MSSTYYGREPDFDLSDAVYGMDKLDLDALREAAQEAASTDAENACIYTSKCLDIIRDYERHPDANDTDDLMSEQTYKASEWTDAMVAYANAIMYSVLAAAASRLVDEVEEAAETLCAAVSSDDRASTKDLRVSLTCPHGWAPHDREDEDGVHYWSPGQLEGCHAVAIKVAGIWLSYTWTPASE